MTPDEQAESVITRPPLKRRRVKISKPVDSRTYSLRLVFPANYEDVAHKRAAQAMWSAMSQPHCLFDEFATRAPTSEERAVDDESYGVKATDVVVRIPLLNATLKGTYCFNDFQVIPETDQDRDNLFEIRTLADDQVDPAVGRLLERIAEKVRVGHKLSNEEMGVELRVTRTTIQNYKCTPQSSTAK